MNDIKFACPHCTQHITAPPDMAGDAIECPTCKKPMTVPAVVIEPAVQSPQEPVPRTQADGPLFPSIPEPVKKKPARRRAIVIAVIVCVVLGVCLLLAVRVVARAKKPTISVNFTEPEEIAKCITMKDVTFKEGVFSCTYLNKYHPPAKDPDDIRLLSQDYTYTIDVQTFTAAGAKIDNDGAVVTDSEVSKPENENGMVLTVKTETKGQRVSKVVVTHKTERRQTRNTISAEDIYRSTVGWGPL